ncbi:MAG: hypothetical protein IPG18_18450 [Saprospiraceae bacterium]|nr:hypothetical protein [Saprospiraceae bacterium]MBK6567122.1 hypothetical protein [Saprospiraceae bacterium]MBK7524806.1 hypothetical protein [Saprospiraceae bacterium]MBK8372585.1 hypothetical protein [Saprospiraceae bacterium]MBK8855182.1 hypothetical protein [Saprospiraceae bacterium]
MKDEMLNNLYTLKNYTLAVAEAIPEITFYPNKDALGKSDMTDDFITGFNSIIDHITHHCAQAVLFLRYSNINPPAYIYY